MSRTDITYLVVAVAGLLCLATWIGLIAIPAWRSYSGLWQRLVALVASAYVFVAILGAGAGAGALFLYYYGEI